MAQSLTDMSTRNLPGSKTRPTLEAINLTAICGTIVQKIWELLCLTTLRHTRPVTGIALPLFYCWFGYLI
jgi:hypothetical protein